jgi:hypothetical protein
MRTEAMSLLRDAMHANLSPTSWRPSAAGRPRRPPQGAYYAAVASRSSWQARLTAPVRPLPA